MGEVWVWYSKTTAVDSMGLLSYARELLQEDEQLWAVGIGEEPPEVLPFCQGIRFCRASGGPGHLGDILARMAREYRPEIILFPSGYGNSAVAAAAAAALDTGLSADCTELRRDGHLLVMHRPAFGGGVVADIVCAGSRPQMATIRPDAITPRIGICVPPEVDDFPAPSCGPGPVTLLSVIHQAAKKSVTEAEIIVSGGLGVGSRENYRIIEQLAQALGGMPGASRAAVDAGFTSWRFQVGQTGNIVHPKLYLAFGISGAVQHIMGMHASGLVISVNTDAHAPIFDYSDYGVVGDWKSTALQWLQYFQKS